MYFLIKADDKNRLYVPHNGMRVDPRRDGQGITHGFSYLHVRQMEQEMGNKMGLDVLVEENPDILE
ncbi:MAG: hypothetical protein ACE5DM_01060 [Candidatus Nanoarchaeia archaeon]